MILRIARPVLASALILGLVACDNARTSGNLPGVPSAQRLGAGYDNSRSSGPAGGSSGSASGQSGSGQSGSGQGGSGGAGAGGSGSSGGSGSGGGAAGGSQ
jgi:hypothetical protein